MSDLQWWCLLLWAVAAGVLFAVVIALVWLIGTDSDDWPPDCGVPVPTTPKPPIRSGHVGYDPEAR